MGDIGRTVRTPRPREVGKGPDTRARSRTGPDRRILPAMRDVLRVRQLEVQAELHTHLQGVREFRKALAFAGRELQSALAPARVAVAVRAPDGKVQLQHASPGSKPEWDLELLRAYLAGERPYIPSDTVVAPVERRSRNWAVLALHDPGAQFTPAHRQLLFGVAQTLSQIIDRIDAARLRDTRRRIEVKIADRQEPRDVIYDILHGIRSLTHYDHSSSFYLHEERSDALKLVAEQIAWTKAKSQRIGTSVPIDAAVRGMLHRSDVLRFRRGTSAWEGHDDDRLPELLAVRGSFQTGSPAPPEVAMILAPIVTPTGSLGMLKVSARRLGILEDYETELIREFHPLASLALQYSMRTETLQSQVVESERKHVLADLTRGISHDVNNALGSVLPLVQQIREEVSEGSVDREGLQRDLVQIEESLQTCRRIFGGMLGIARGAARPVGQANLRRAVDSALSVLEEGMRRRGIRLQLEVPDEVPEIRTGQNDLTQLFLNLFSNARDAMPRGGVLSLQAVVAEGHVAVAVGDTGEGIPEAEQGRIFQSFYTSKPGGNGLGLTVCGSVIRNMSGSIDVESRPGEGTTFHMRLPTVPEAAAGAEDPRGPEKTP